MEQLSFFEKSVRIVNKYGSIKVLKSIILVGLFLFTIIFIPLLTKYFVSSSFDIVEKNRLFQHSNEIEKREAMQSQIYSTLETLINNTGAQRGFIIELHNGFQNVNGVPFLHGTVTYEKVKEGYDHIDEEYQNLTLSRYELSSYLHNNYIFIGTIESLMKVDKRIGGKLLSDGITYVAISTLHDGDTEWGWFGVLFSDEEPRKNKEELLSNLMITSQIINNMLGKVHEQ